jgi:CheY-like chemotaxis protein
MKGGGTMKRVLVIEKDAVTARRMGSLWESAGYETCLVTDVGRAAFDAGRWHPDLITLNLEGSEGEGREVLLQLLSRPQTSRTPVVLFSGKEKKSIPQALMASVQAVFEKPVFFERQFEKTPEFISVPG